MEKTVCLLALVLSGCFAALQFRIDDCNNDKKLLHVNQYAMTPYPPNIPGDVTPSGHLILGHNISGLIQLDVKIRKKTLFWLPVPCIANVGSCSYNFCDLLNSAFVRDGTTQCPRPMSKQNLPCTCPFQAGSYTLNPEVWSIQALPSTLSWLMRGDYKVDATLTNKDTGEQVGCIHVEITLGRPCSGLACIFG